MDSFVVMLRGFALLRARRDIWANVWGKQAYPPRNKKAFAHFVKNYSGKWYEFKFGFTDDATINVALQWGNNGQRQGTTATNIVTAKRTFVEKYLRKAIQELPATCGLVNTAASCR